MKEAMQAIGTRRWLPIEGGRLQVVVKVQDVKMAYGRLRYLVAPVTGGGEAWIDAERTAPAVVGGVLYPGEEP